MQIPLDRKVVVMEQEVQSLQAQQQTHDYQLQTLARSVSATSSPDELLTLLADQHLQIQALIGGRELSSRIQSLCDLLENCQGILDEYPEALWNETWSLPVISTLVPERMNLRVQRVSRDGSHLVANFLATYGGIKVLVFSSKVGWKQFDSGAWYLMYPGEPEYLAVELEEWDPALPDEANWVDWAKQEVKNQIEELQAAAYHN